MASLPKRKVSKSRVRTRRSNSYFKMEPPTIVKCPQCFAPKLPHFVCTKCGYYNTKVKVLDVEEK